MSSIYPTISVIVPLYNGEKYIINCLDSIRNQNYPSIEIVIVNDESKDNSAELVHAYRKKYQDFLKFILIDQNNQGQGAARNTGIKNATGKYLTFLDQDDALADGILLKMLLKAESEHADIVSCGYCRITDNGKTRQKVSLKQTEWSKYKIIAPWSKLYRTDFINRNKISFLPVVLGEDIYFLMQIYSHSPKILFLEDIGYKWTDNTCSVSNTTHKKLARETSLLTLFNMLDKLEYSQALKQDKMYEYFLLKTAIWDILYTSRNNPYALIKENADTIWKWFRNHFPDHEKNPYLKITAPKGEDRIIRLIVWGYMKIKKWRFENLFLKLLCKTNFKKARLNRKIHGTVV